MNFSHEMIEKNSALMIVLIILVVAVGGLVEIVPLYFQKSTTEAVAGLKPYTPVQLAGRDIYLREGCYNCHSQMIRPVSRRDRTLWPLSVAGEFVYDHPFQWAASAPVRTCIASGGKYSDDWHRTHLNNPRDLCLNRTCRAIPGWRNGGEERRHRVEDAGAAQRRRAL